MGERPLPQSPEEALATIHPAFAELQVGVGVVSRGQFEDVYQAHTDEIQARFVELVEEEYREDHRYIPGVCRKVKGIEPSLRGALFDVPRHHFALSLYREYIPWQEVAKVYQDSVTVQQPALYHGGEIYAANSSEPHLVAIMLKYAMKGLKVARQNGRRPVFVEIGSGLGYNLALAARSIQIRGWEGEVHGFEIQDYLAGQSVQNLSRAKDPGYGLNENVFVHYADGKNLPGVEKVDAIIVSAAVKDRAVIEGWIDRLNQGGRLLVPVEVRVNERHSEQHMHWIYTDESKKGYRDIDLGVVSFVNLI